MFCQHCGAELEDGAKFCTTCGTPVEDFPATEQEPAPEAPAAEVPVAEAAPAAPGNTPVYQDVPDTPAEDEPPEPPKKKFNTRIAAIAAAAVIVIAIIAISFPALANFVSKTFSKPEDYYHKVEMNNLDGFIEGIGNAYGSLLEAAGKTDNIGFEASVEVEAGKSLKKFLRDIGGDSYMDPEEMFGWIEAVKMDITSGRKGDYAGGGLGLSLNKNKILSANYVINMEEGELYAQVPELSKSYIDLSEALQAYQLYQFINSLPYDMRSLANYIINAAGEVALDELEELVNKLVKQLPDQKAFEKLLEKYVRIAVECIDDVEKGRDELSAGDVEAKYTTLQVTIDDDTVRDMAEKILAELQKDKDVRKYIINVCNVFDLDGEDIYDEFLDALEDAEDEIDYIDFDDEVKMTLYVNGTGNVVGREIVSGGKDYSTTLKFAAVTRGTKGGIEVSMVSKYGKEKYELFSLSGDGKLSGTTLNGDLTLKVEGDAIGDISFEKFSIIKLKQGYLSGKLTFKPSKDLISQMYLSDTEESIVKKLSLTVELDTEKKASHMKYILNSGDSALVSISVDYKQSSAGKYSAPKNAEEPYDWLDTIDSGSVKDVLKSLKKAGVPSDYLDALEDELDYIL